MRLARVLRRVPRFPVVAGLAPAVTVLLLVAVPPRPVRAQGLQVTRLEFMTQSVKVKGQSFVTGLGLRMHLAGGDLNPGFVVAPTFSYWRDLDIAPEAGIQQLEQRDWRLGADVRYRFGSDEGWTPYAGAGLALHLVKTAADVALPGIPRVVTDDTGRKLAPSVLAGVDLPASGPIRNAIELDYAFVPGLKQFTINWGIGWRFGPRGD